MYSETEKLEKLLARENVQATREQQLLKQAVEELTQTAVKDLKINGKY